MIQGAVQNSFTYDKNGNLLREDPGARDSNVYDRENRLIRSQTTPSTFTYDGDDLRRSLIVNSGITTFVWDGDDYLQERS